MSWEWVLICFLLLIAEPLWYMRKKLQLGAAIAEVNVSSQEKVLRCLTIAFILYLFVSRDATEYQAVFINFSNIPAAMQLRYAMIGIFLLAAFGFTIYALFKKPEIFELGFTVPFKAIKWKDVESYRLSDCKLEIKLKRFFSKDYKLIIPSEMREPIVDIIHEQLNGKERV